jgi:transposase InsO family protein
VRFGWIRAHVDAYPVAAMCAALSVSRSGYYAWSAASARGPGPRAARRLELAAKVRAAHAASRGTYGSPRVYHALKAAGEVVCENTVARVMKAEGIRSVVGRRSRVRTTDAAHGHAVAPNVLNRAFDQPAPDLAWAADITYVPTDEGWLYVGAVIDLCSRKVVGWAMGESLKAELCVDALAMAVGRRDPAEGLVHHSDRGVQTSASSVEPYACGVYRALLAADGIVCSMSGKGDCWDNAVAESFFKTLKVELVYQTRYRTRAEARRSIFEYIEVFYNRQRLHSTLGYVSPEQFEAALAGPADGHHGGAGRAR